MRKKTVQVLLGAALIAAMCLGAPTAAFADETTTKEETAEKTGDKDSAEEKETAEDFQIGELTVKNQSGLEVKSAELQDAKEDDSKKKDSKDAAGHRMTGKNLFFIMSMRSFIFPIQMKKENLRKRWKMRRRLSWKKLPLPMQNPM